MAYSSTSSGRLTADAAVIAAPAMLHAIRLTADGTNAATLRVYDNASAASGTVVAELSIAALQTGDFMHLDCPVYCNNGIYIDIGGTGASCVVYYSPA